MKIVCLGNEFIEGDSFAKEVGELLRKDFVVVNVNDSFQLMSLLSEEKDFVLLDVVKDLEEVCFIRVDDLKSGSILSAHDFDAGFVLKLIGDDVKIIGIPMSGDLDEVAGEVARLISGEKL